MTPNEQSPRDTTEACGSVQKERFIVDEIEVEDLAVDGICGVY